MRIVCGTVGEDEHSVGLREIIDIKHGGIEKYGISVTYLGTSVPPEKLVNAAIELDADAILAVSYTHLDVYKRQVLYICVYALQNANTLCYNADITNILEAGVKYG